MSGEYEEKKAAYENLAAGLESNMSKLEQVKAEMAFAMFFAITLKYIFDSMRLFVFVGGSRSA